MRYNIRPGMTFTELVISRKVKDNAVVGAFALLPFAADVEDWRAPGETFTWVSFTDGSYWLWSEGQHYGIIAIR